MFGIFSFVFLNNYKKILLTYIYLVIVNHYFDLNKQINSNYKRTCNDLDIKSFIYIQKIKNSFDK